MSLLAARVAALTFQVGVRTGDMALLKPLVIAAIRILLLIPQF
jgi:hypothetical protein